MLSMYSSDHTNIRSPDQQGDTWATVICFLIIGTSLSEPYTTTTVLCMSVCLWPLNRNPKLNFWNQLLQHTFNSNATLTVGSLTVKVCMCCKLLSNSTESHEWLLTGTCNTTGATSNIKRREVLQLMPHELDFSFKTKTTAGKRNYLLFQYFLRMDISLSTVLPEGRQQMLILGSVQPFTDNVLYMVWTMKE